MSVANNSPQPQRKRKTKSQAPADHTPQPELPTTDAAIAVEETPAPTKPVKPPAARKPRATKATAKADADAKAQAQAANPPELLAIPATPAGHSPNPEKSPAEETPTSPARRRRSNKASYPIQPTQTTQPLLPLGGSPAHPANLPTPAPNAPIRAADPAPTRPNPIPTIPANQNIAPAVPADGADGADDADDADDTDDAPTGPEVIVTPRTGRNRRRRRSRNRADAPQTNLPANNGPLTGDRTPANPQQTPPAARNGHPAAPAPQAPYRQAAPAKQFNRPHPPQHPQQRQHGYANHHQQRPHPQHAQHQQYAHKRPEPRPEPRETVSGVLEISDRGTGSLRNPERNLNPSQNDPIIPQRLIQKLKLRSGAMIEGLIDPRNKAQPPQVIEVNKVMGRPYAEWLNLTKFEDLTVIDPREQLRFEFEGGPATNRIIDLMTPIGRGQRGLIVAPPRSGKTIILQQIAKGIETNYPELRLMIMLIDERPEEVTEMRRSCKAEVFASSNDLEVKSHVRIARLCQEKAQRHLENGEHVVILLDSLTRLGRAFNNWVGSSGRTMSGGMDIKAMEEPKRIFGAARNIEHAGSLTIIATCLIDTGSRMDQLIFEEFKGTGNMEIVLDREMANKRVYPAIDLQASGTRKEHLLLGDANYEKISRHIRRSLIDMRSNVDRMEAMLKKLSYHKSNKDLLDSLPA